MIQIIKPIIVRLINIFERIIQKILFSTNQTALIKPVANINSANLPHLYCLLASCSPKSSMVLMAKKVPALRLKKTASIKSPSKAMTQPSPMDKTFNMACPMMSIMEVFLGICLALQWQPIDKASAHLWKAMAIEMPRNQGSDVCTPIAIPQNIVWK